mgnify:CR=1 FL=1
MNKFLIKRYLYFLTIIILILFLNKIFIELNLSAKLKFLINNNLERNSVDLVSLEKKNNELIDKICQSFDFQVDDSLNLSFTRKNISQNNSTSKNSNDFISSNKNKSSLKQTEEKKEEDKKVEFPININLATLEELCAIPGIGPVLAQRIIEYRNKNGPFKTPSDLLNVKGIGEKKLQTILQYIVF